VTGFLRSHYVHVGATATAAIVALGLVTVPPARYDSMTARTEFAAVQLKAAVSTEVVALANTLPIGRPAGLSDAAAVAPLSPQAAATSDSNVWTLETVAIVALAIVGTPLWWLGFPVTLPLSLIFGGIAAGVGLDLINKFYQIDCFTCGPAPSQVGSLSSLIAGIPLGLLTFAVAPILLAGVELTKRWSPTETPAAASARRSARSAAAITPVKADALGIGETAVTDPASAAETTPPIATQTRTRRSPARLSSRAAAQPAASATVVANTKATAAAKPTAAQRSARGAAHRAERSVANASG
jgi:hypothetical protein